MVNRVQLKRRENKHRLLYTNLVIVKTPNEKVRGQNILEISRNSSFTRKFQLAPLLRKSKPIENARLVFFVAISRTFESTTRPSTARVRTDA